jgi:hypothetical protein
MINTVNGRTPRLDLLLVFVILYGAASLVHHVHNAVYLDAYPGLPASLTAARVVLAWSGETAIGLLGYLLSRRGRGFAGFSLLGIYAGLGLYGLLHYRLAPMSAHTVAMNATIWLEVGSAMVLLIAVASLVVTRRRETEPG